MISLDKRLPICYKKAKDCADQTKRCVRLSLSSMSYGGGILNVPSYIADEFERIIEIALKQIKPACGKLSGRVFVFHFSVSAGFSARSIQEQMTPRPSLIVKA